MIAVPSQPTPHHRDGWIPWLAGGLIALAALLAWQTQYFVDPETTLLPWLMSRGWVLYRDIIDQHPPLFPALLAGLGAAGDPGTPLRLLILAGRVGTLALTYLVASRWAGRPAGLGALVLAEGWLVPFEGTHLWYDGALGPVYLGVLGLVSAGSRAGDRGPWGGGWWRRGGRALAVGVLLGIGLLIKQHVVLAIPFVVLALLRLPDPDPPRARRDRLVWLGVGLAVPLAGVGLWLAAVGALDAAWYWVVEYSLRGNYAALAAQGPAPGEWPLLAALYAPVPALVVAGFIRRAEGSSWGARLLLLGLLLAATLPAWPRYGRFHFQAAVPLLAVAGGVAGAELGAAWRATGGWRTLGARLGLGLVAVGLLTGAGQWLQGGTSMRDLLGPPQPVYARTVEPLRAWVAARTPPQTPIFIYGLDAMLYRLLEREPPRPWAPAKLPWIMAARDTEARFWEGVTRARPAVVLVSAYGWDRAPQAGPDSEEARLRADYQEAARFSISNYRLTPPVVVVGLLRTEK